MCVARALTCVSALCDAQLNFNKENNFSTNQKQQSNNYVNRVQRNCVTTVTSATFGLLVSVCMDTWPEANHLLFKMWIFPFEICSWISRTKKNCKNIENQPSKNRTRYPAFKMIIFRRAFNLCIAHELSWAEPMSTIKTAPISILIFVESNLNERVLFTVRFFFISFCSPLSMICIWLQFW